MKEYLRRLFCIHDYSVTYRTYEGFSIHLLRQKKYMNVWYIYKCRKCGKEKWKKGKTIGE